MPGNSEPYPDALTVSEASEFKQGCSLGYLGAARIRATAEALEASLSRVAELETEYENAMAQTRAALDELTAQREYERDVSAARLAALEWLRDTQLLRVITPRGVLQATTTRSRDYAGQSAEVFYRNLSAAIGKPVGPREGEQG